MTEEVKYSTIIVKPKGFKQAVFIGELTRMFCHLADMTVHVSEKAARPDYPTHMEDRYTYKVIISFKVVSERTIEVQQVIQSILETIGILFDMEVIW